MKNLILTVDDGGNSRYVTTWVSVSNRVTICEFSLAGGTDEGTNISIDPKAIPALIEDLQKRCAEIASGDS